MVILETYKTNIVEFKQIFMTLIETIMNIITNKIREVSCCQIKKIIFHLINFRF